MSGKPPGAPADGRRIAWLHDGWQLARAAPDACASPAELDSAPLEWRDAVVPGTVASSVHTDPDLPGQYDAHDWWYRLRFQAADRVPGASYRLRFDGLATLAQAWLNGEPLLASRNMFLPCTADATALLRDDNELVIRFASLERAMARKGPRARWRTALVSRQELRGFRTTLLGRIPGWTPPITPVGPWGPIALECVESAALDALRLDAEVNGTAGRLRLDARVALRAGLPIQEARLRLDGRPYALAIDGTRIHADLEILDAPLWWPHTHGVPRLMACRVELRAGGEWLEIDCGAVGFRRITLDTGDGRVRFLVNGVPLFCRGACWTPLDMVSLRSDPAALREALVAVRDAGANMLRVGGTMVYESPEFYRLCDELGILVWQDFMFANMDYPVGDAQFRAQVEAEARHHLGRLHRHPCIAAWCGGSEIAQQVAMLGLPARDWCNDFFGETLPRLCGELHPGVPYFPSTPWGGALPFHVATGISHYYGVGAYRRPLSDARCARVKFATECLAFANVPDAQTSALVLGSPSPPPHHPKWKAGVPRDSGPGWDFEDVRDHYLAQLFKVDPVALRSRDLARYHALSRVVTGEVMRRVFAEWRSAGSECGGGLVWFLRDLRPGAGWGVIDATGRPKAAYWYLKRAWAARGVHITDEGLDGLAIHVVNDAPEPLAATIELEMLRADGVSLESASQAVLVAARGTVTLGAEAMVGHFCDSAAAYRFGPPRHDVVIVRLRDGSGRTLAEDFHFPEGMALPMRHDAKVRAEARWDGEGRVVATIESDTFLQAVSVACDGFAPDDNHFHLAPGREKRIAFRALGRDGARFTAHLEALNLAAPVTVRAVPGAQEQAG